MPEDLEKPQTRAQPDDTAWLNPETRWKQANEAWLQAHWKMALPVILGIALAVFILPWVFFSFLTALGIQVFGAAAFWAAAKRYTTAFDKKNLP